MNRTERRAIRKSTKARVAPSDALLEAIRRHRLGDLDAAERVYVRELDAAPLQPDALHFLGVLRHQQRRTAEGLHLVLRALAVAPDYVDAWNNLGNMHKESGRLREAERAYRHALALDLEHGDAWNNLGVVMTARGEPGQAVGAFRRAVECKPRTVEAYIGLGAALLHCGLTRDAIDALRRATALSPGHVRARRELGRVLFLAGERDEAAAVFRAWLEIEPTHPVAIHMLAACSGENVPMRASDAFVRATFDDFAHSFDEVLLQRLDYHAPELLVASLGAVLGVAKPASAVLDAGCGTGLCGALLKPFAATLSGVDISGGMLRRAELRGVYDRLIQDEITHFLDEHAGTFDVIASADTLCYFGDLDRVSRAAHRSLRAGGWFGFTVERTDDVEYRINPHGRYNHSRGYLACTLERCGFTSTQVDEGVLRRENGQPVHGYIVRARAMD